MTCIISQLDFKAGTRGDGACILSGKESPANPTIKSDIGLLIEPIIGVLILDSRTIVVKVIPQAKNNNDS